MPTRHLDLLRQARHIAKNPAQRGVLSTSQILAVALVLNKPEWVSEEHYTLADAIERVGTEWLDLALRAARDLHDPDIS